MPVPLRTHKAAAEARYNVTTECNLGLHSAAATGNVGLVEYALTRGQPINSVLDGVLPLHAAAAGGNESVVKLLIERGADVNAPRLPRRYSNDRNRDTTAPIVGTSGSTPLHFAAANGHTNIVHTLLLRGAHASRPDKHGITPEMLARQNGWDECAEILKTWIINKDRDLRERQGPTDTVEPTSGRDRGDSVGEGESSTRKRLHMKRSMDTALSMLKGSSEALKPPLPSASTSNLPATTSTPPPSPGMRPFGEYTFYSNSPSPSPIDPGSRRPSLPQITYPAPPPVNRKTSLVVGGKHRRPRSAGTDAERDAEVTPASGRNGTGSKKLVSKYSLLNMFKKGETNASGVALERTDTQPSTSSPSASSSNVALPSAEASPASANLSDSPAPYRRRASNMSPSPQSSQLPGMHKSPTRPPIPLAAARQGITLPGSRPRGLSLTSSSQSSLSPALSTVDAADPTLTLRTDFPFSINSPPVIPADDGALSALDNRGRGDSVSSTSTTESQINPQMSASGTTSGSGSVTVTTPLHVPEVLAVSPQGSPLPLQVQLDTDGGSNAPPTTISSRLNERRTHTPLDINLSLISSHAQASALVQKELQDILEMPVVSPDVKTTNFVPLSARLAAYGESLQLERRFRQQPRAGASSGSNLGPQSRPRHNGVDRQNSVDIKPTRRRVKEPRRPHTSSGTDSPSTECKCIILTKSLCLTDGLLLSVALPTHHSSRSTSAVSSQADLRTDRTVPIVAQTAATAAEVARANNRVRRARTPDPVIGLSRVSSLDGIESIDVELGPTLTRVSTAPMAPGSRDKSRDFAKQMASANKLTRMGFSPAPAKPDPAQSKRFGGLRSLVNTLKGKP
ncbi:hypothetical protein DFH08DRAFT_695778 [Mycena albidolilacea]|uniref:Ankyrin n=1 Tax=Mycena albidolilacea TaxID=1033008 RepID=A0AAD7A5Z7_9AGAR|nr:hypothetical protein DFH08DRAFT_695778 [Mycena albidolilacea]